MICRPSLGNQGLSAARELKRAGCDSRCCSVLTSALRARIEAVNTVLPIPSQHTDGLSPPIPFYMII